MDKTQNPNKIEANLNFGMSTAKQQHCVIQPQILPNLLDHYQKKETGDNHASVVIGALMGTTDGNIIDISNSFHLTLKIAKTEENKKEQEYIFDTEYLKKMVKFYTQVNNLEKVLGVYISTTKLDKLGMIIVHYFARLFNDKIVKSPLKLPIIMLFDPELSNNKLEIKVSQFAVLTRLGAEHPLADLQRLPSLQ